MLKFVLKNQWPKLAWVCVLDPVDGSAVVMHGPSVEINENWAVEAVWDGAFSDGGFDKTDLIFGSGIRQRNNELIFVSSATGVDRLWHVKLNNNIYVSNTLPGLLSVTSLSLREDYFNYSEDIMSIETKGLYSYIDSIPSSGPDIYIVYFKNLIWNFEDFLEADKPDITPMFLDFCDYENFLKKTAIALGENARSPLRKNQVDMLVGISSGYDSVATAVVSRYAGCKKATSIMNSSSIWRGSDSGKQISKKLGLECQLVKQSKENYKLEVSTWAAAGHAGGRNFTLFDYPKPLCLFFNGSYGDVIWDRNNSDLKEPTGNNSLMACEFRLIEGFFVTVVPFWGVRKARDIKKISLIKEMEPWTLGTNYDRPIARRLAEEAGIRRGTFAIRKKDTASNKPYWWPSTKKADLDFRNFLLSRGIKPPSRIVVKSFSYLSVFMQLLNNNFLLFVPYKVKWKPWKKSKVRHLFFVWANHSLRDKYF